MIKGDDKAPATKKDIRSLKGDIEVVLEALQLTATKDDLKRYATKEDLKRFATKEDLKRFATKEDLKKEIGKIEKRLDIHDAQFDILSKYIHDQIQELKTELYEYIENKAVETHRHMGVIADELRHDALGANKDQIELLKDTDGKHEKRIHRLEARAGIVC